MRVLIADRDSLFIKNLKEYLIPAGYQVVAEASDGITALRLVHTIQPDLVVLDAFLPGMDGWELGSIIEESKLASVILVATYSEQQVIDQKGEWPFPILPKPVDLAALKSVIDYVISTSRRVAALEKEVQKLQRDLSVRKVVEKAKGILMNTQGLSEEAAFKKIQQLSMKKRLSMKKVAEAIILANEK